MDGKSGKRIVKVGTPNVFKVLGIHISGLSILEISRTEQKLGEVTHQSIKSLIAESYRAM